MRLLPPLYYHQRDYDSLDQCCSSEDLEVKPIYVEAWDFARRDGGEVLNERT